MTDQNKTISKMETIQEAANKYYSKYQFIGDSSTYAAFVAGSAWQKEHSYSEQEVVEILETLKYRCLNSARIDHYGYDSFRIDKESIIGVEYNDLLKPNTNQ